MEFSLGGFRTCYLTEFRGCGPGFIKLKLGEVLSGASLKYVRQLEGGIAYVASIVPRKGCETTAGAA